jgi:hypothetical protein
MSKAGRESVGRVFGGVLVVLSTWLVAVGRTVVEGEVVVGLVEGAAEVAGDVVEVVGWAG